MSYIESNKKIEFKKALAKYKYLGCNESFTKFTIGSHFRLSEIKSYIQEN
jgi:hypothetical protein